MTSLDTPPHAADVNFRGLLSRQAAGRSMAQAFYADPDVFRRDLDRIFMRHWLCVGHESDLPAAGDFMTFEIAGESIIVARGKDGQLRAMANVCRHRGSRVCTAPRGKTAVFVRPYHAWAYGLDGSLRAIPHAATPAERSNAEPGGLKQFHLRVVQGLLLVSLADTPLGLDRATEALNAAYGPYGWATARVAHRETYRIAANWKLAVENYVECYHCGPAHLEYSKLHALALPSEKIEALNARMEARTAACGVEIPHRSHWDSSVDSGEEAVFSFRYALHDGIRTGSEDGQPVAPLMGAFTDYDGGVTSTHFGPASFFAAYADYGVLYRIMPRALQTCDMELIWLVRGDAVAGADYDLAKLTWLWQVTSDADKRIVEENQKGVNSRFYEPGPFTPMEKNARRYVEWYLREIADSASNLL